MDHEPSLLDYLKALIDPRRERIRLEDPLLPTEDRPHVSQSDLIETANVSGEQGKSFYPVDEPEIQPAVDVPERVMLAAASSKGPFPWRTLGMLFAALAGQSALAPPDRSEGMGLLLYLASFVLGYLAVRAGEMTFPRLPRRRYDPDHFEVSGVLLWAALPVILIAFIALGGNRFTTFNLFFWLLGLLLLILGLRTGWEMRERWWPRFTAWVTPPYQFSVTPWMTLVFCGVLLVLFFRFYHLDQVPSQMFSDHAEKLQDVQDVLSGQTRIFFPRNTGREFVQMYLTAFTAQVLGYGLNFMALKMGTALAGLVTFPFIYLLGAELANRRVGFLAMVLAGVSYWLNVITRVALRFSLYPLFVAPVFYFVVRGLRRGNRNDFIWAGIFLGLGLHGYSPFRFVPLLVVLAVVLFILHVRPTARRRQALWHLLVVVAVSFVVFLPLLRFITESDANRSIVLYRGLTRVGTVESEYPGNPAVILIENMGRSMAMFAWENGNTWVHSIPNRPALDVVSGALFYLGYFLLLLRYLRQRNWEDLLLILSVPMLLLPSALSLAFPQENPSLNRSGGAIVPVFLIAALALDGFLVAVRNWVGGRGGRFAAWVAVGFLLLWSSMANYDLIFRQYSEQFTRSAWNTTELGSVIRGFADSVGSEESAWVIPWPHWVDTRLVGINAGVYIRDYAIPREQLPGTQSVAGPKMFLFHVEDTETLIRLEELYPEGIIQRFSSEYPGKDFMIYTTLGP